MLFIILQHLVRSIIRHIPCPHCKKKFTIKDIYISDLLDGELFIDLDCKNCQNNTILGATVTENSHGIQIIKETNENRKSLNPISKREIDEMNKKLESSTGGFQELFTEMKKKKL